LSQGSKFSQVSLTPRNKISAFPWTLQKRGKVREGDLVGRAPAICPEETVTERRMIKRRKTECRMTERRMTEGRKRPNGEID
jgi:hypothetical protein